ncbi:hypothetical protein MKW98_029571 [Papaver atlanticum]|uniref:RING-type domain-containing protein n=1 Tax=Papaver atlanticum TaxID=357466 RepID=A0AAD4S328_9MAGN|nr:hypothetical protein MKW98_029571 [Papaver atlanticum]
MELNLLGRRSGKSPQRIAIPPPVYSSQPSHMSSFKPSSTLYDSSSVISRIRLFCPICLSNPKDMAFGCGHQTCCECGQDLQLCPIC